MLDEPAGKSIILILWLIHWASFRAIFTFADWWDAYIKDFFSASAEETSKKLFGDQPKKTLAQKSKETAQGLAFPGGRAIKRADVVVMTTTPTLVVAIVVPITPSKRLRREAETTVKLIVAPVVEEYATLKPVIAHVDVGPATATLEKVASMVERNLSPNPKKNLVIVLEEEENDGEVPLLVRCPQRVEPPTTSPLPLDKGKCVASPLGDLQPAVEAAGQVDLQATEVGREHEVTPSVEPEAMAKMPVHP
ncbi:histone deacetylase 5-like [Pyrus ussuriensis x Pyrus communis]|uniref:Histone deacetylase 5-like n=1 Tax=Pyrus ussuriensis x Pyrus communis TaxID=2448454 RepID=A0A5N5FPD4_9ROSA|nr:histone deacetylase 5-like [Pyrus ussuriensis x Pyrus communis]